jgi:hypothetical protein
MAKWYHPPISGFPALALKDAKRANSRPKFDQTVRNYIRGCDVILNFRIVKNRFRIGEAGKLVNQTSTRHSVQFSVAVPDTVPFWPLDTGSGIVFFPDPRSQPILLRVKDNFLGKLKLTQIFFFNTSKLN